VTRPVTEPTIQTTSQFKNTYSTSTTCKMANNQAIELALADLDSQKCPNYKATAENIQPIEAP
jgi:hypothetical protein